MSEYLLLESGFKLVLEEGTGDLLLEESTPVTTGNYLVQEEDGTSRITLEDGSGFILLEEASITPVATFQVGGSFRPRTNLRTLRRLDDDEAAALMLLIATRRRYRINPQ